jgi:hypothetical protein
METQSSTQLDYKKTQFVHPNYRMSKLLPQSGGQTVAISSAGGQETIFEIPVKAFNLARSFVSFVVTPTGLAANYNWSFVDCFNPFRQLQLYTRSGIYLCDLNEVGNYTKVMWKPEIKLEEFLDYDYLGNATVYTESNGRYLCRNNTLQNSATSTLLAPYGLRFNNSNSNIAYTEPKYLEPGSALNTADPVLSVSIPFSAFKNTAFAYDKDLWLNEIIVCRIVWQGTPKMMFNGTSVTNPTAGAAAFTGNINISNLTMYLAVEKNQDIVNSLQALVAAQGLQTLIPYVYTYKYNTGNATSYSVSYRFNRGHGMKLLKVYHSAFNNTESANTAYDHDNKGTSKVNQFYTMLDNERSQEYNLNTATYDDYLLLRDKLKGSVIQSSDMFYHNWVWIEDWTGFVDKTIEPRNIQNIETGLDLTTERKWDFYALQVNNGTAAAYNTYTFAVTQKMLTVTSSGITVI